MISYMYTLGKDCHQLNSYIHHHTFYSILFYAVLFYELLRPMLSKFQFCNIVSPAVVTTLYIRSSDLVLL